MVQVLSLNKSTRTAKWYNTIITNNFITNMETLPPYFKEYMEQKFNELHQKIDTVFDKHDTEIEEIRKDVSWLKQKIWMALGALAVISVVGGVFATYFKELNKN